MIAVTVREYLDRLAAAEGQKHPHRRRDVPTISALADAAGVSRTTIYNLPHVGAVNLAILDAILKELQRRGFETTLTDLLTVYEDENETEAESKL